ncbi:hypothetical protein N7457_000421, partial [Penicillium paradoxum]|uniref:uncharacterized protein n=1 Tax=Penicillium paradoxum TaxID=176176 RepID=UPI0025483907
KHRQRGEYAYQPYERRAVNEHAGTPKESPHTGPSPEAPNVLVQSTTSGFGKYTNKNSVDSHLSSLSKDIILKSLNGFTGKYPEFAILNHSAFIKEFQSPISDESKILLAVILASSRVQFTLLGLPWEDSLLPREHYVSYAREMLSEWSFKAPKVQVAQASLIMSLYEWGSREFHRAWIYCGIAIRIIQALNSLRVSPYPLDPTPPSQRDAVSVAVENRTFWACFIMDRMVSSGTYNPPMLPMSEMEKLKVSCPLSAVDFVFGPDLSSERTNLEQDFTTAQAAQTAPLDVTQSFKVLVSGFDIWAHIMTFIFNDGRRAPGMCALQNCPWAPGSPWSKTMQHLREWRATQHHRLHYPENSVLAHTTLGWGESFTYINLLYYTSTLMLHREYFPFLPTAGSIPRGPIDQPTLEAEAPEGWWDESALVLFGTAEKIAKLLHDASECGAEMLTPFVGFCAFSAAYMNLYAFRFPQMNLGRSPNAETNLNYCLAYLEKFRHVWKLGESWITTINHASILYQRAASDKSRYQGKTRTDFNNLHQSLHEFRVPDRSDQHLQEIEGAERPTVPSSPYNPVPAADIESDIVDLDMPLNNLLSEVNAYAHEQGMWSHWWPPLEEVNLAPFHDPQT